MFDRSSDSGKGLEAQRISRWIFQFATVALAVVSIKLKARRNHGYAVRREPTETRPRQVGIGRLLSEALKLPDVGSAAEWTNGRECAKGLNCSAAVIGSSRSSDEQ